MPPAGQQTVARTLGLDPDQEVALKANIALPSVMVDRAFFREAGGFGETFVWAEDHELWLRLAEAPSVEWSMSRCSTCGFTEA